MLLKRIKYGIFNPIYDFVTGEPKYHKPDFGIFIPPQEDIFCPPHPA
jgi:hypothetical protein